MNTKDKEIKKQGSCACKLQATLCPIGMSSWNSENATCIAYKKCPIGQYREIYKVKNGNMVVNAVCAFLAEDVYCHN